MKSYCILVKFDVFFLCGWSKNCENRVNYLKYKCVFGCNKLNIRDVVLKMERDMKSYIIVIEGMEWWLDYLKREKI